MARLNRFIVRNTIVALGILTLGSFFAIRGNPCVERESSEITSPDKKYTLRVGRSACGASQQDKTFVSLERKTWLPSWLGAMESKVWLQGTIDIIPQWLGNNKLVLNCWSCDQAVIAELTQVKVGKMHAQPETFRF